ncbi:formylglycine-generating enzyme family protein [Neobacillus niacini]|nr:formylglycine-generating enzyme family protein [Neobacillus niacini]MCM3763642.1 formylglycine-generating enzyme family protein [Neobacillus niacini]
MILLPGGTYDMGSAFDDGFPEDFETPIKTVTVSPFYIDAYAVSNAEFREFATDTGYVTDAETFGWSYVFHLFLPNSVKAACQSPRQTPWWFAVPGAYWAHPEGPQSSIDGRENHPVVHISWNDANAYCQWAGKRLPTETEWEYAARGGLVRKRYPWGNELLKDGIHQCNIWQGRFPFENTEDDGFIGTAPVDSFAPNNFGLYNTSGNVWEWCQNNFHDKFANPVASSHFMLHAQTYKAIRGGSYLCHDSYCNRYRVAARSANTIESSSGNMGFRCAASIN